MIFLKVNSFLLKNKKKLGNTIRMSNSLDTDQGRLFAGPDLDSTCLQRLSADDIHVGRENVNPYICSISLCQAIIMC